MLKTKQFKPGDHHPTVKLEKKEREIKDVQKTFVKLLKERGGKSWPFRSPSNVGVYDKIAVLPNGDIWFVELKTLNGKLSKQQIIFGQEVRDLDGNEVVIYGTQGVIAWLDHVISSSAT